MTPLQARAGSINVELLDWAEKHLLSLHAHPKGWEVLVRMADGEPAAGGPVLYESKSVRCALALAMGDFERPQTEPLPAIRVEDAGCD